MSSDDTRRQAAGTLPTGTVSFLFSDIEGSTALLRVLKDDPYSGALQAHRDILRKATGEYGGSEIATLGDGTVAAFARASDAVLAAVDAQRALAAFPWAQGAALGVRMGLHTGEPALTAAGYVGLDVHLAARIGAAAHGGQVLVSRATADLVESILPAGVTLRDVGEHVLKDFPQPRRLYQVSVSGLPESFPPPRTLHSATHWLPSLPGRCVGRESEVEELERILLGGGSRLVTLTGPGGVGKTRLALEVGRKVADRFADGVSFVDLDAVEEPSDALSAVALAVGTLAGRGEDTVEALVASLGGRQRLLILDGCERVVSAGGALADVTARCPDLQVLVTSRIHLGLRAEREYPVVPLRTESGAGEGALQGDVAPAVALFLERSGLQGRSPSAEAHTLEVITEICRLLDGLPLAIELAAAKCGALPAATLLQYLKLDRMRLGSDIADLPARQRSLRSAIAWSYEMLPAREQAALRGLSVFAGPFRLEGAAAVIGEDAGGALAVVTSLANQSLVRAVDDEDGGVSFSMLQTIREFVLGELERSGEARASRDRHKNHYRSLAAKFVRGGGRGLSAVEADMDNYRAALAWSLDDGDAPIDALHLATDLGLAWHRHLAEGRRWLTESLARVGDVAPGIASRALFLASTLAHYEGSAEAVPLARRAVTVARGSGRKSGALGMALSRLAIALGGYEEFAEAKTTAAEAVAVLRVVGDPVQLGVAISNEAAIALWAGEFRRTEALFRESIELFHKAGQGWLTGAPLASLGTLARYRGQLKRARMYLDESVATWGERTAGVGKPRALFELGMCALAAGDLRPAGSFFAESLLVARDAGSYAEATPALYGTGLWLCRAGEYAAAARMFAVARGVREAMGQPVSKPDRALLSDAEHKVRSAIGSQAWESEGAAWAWVTADAAFDEGLRALA